MRVLQTFDPSELSVTSNVLIVAKKGRGKTVLVKDLLSHKQSELDVGVLMTSRRWDKEYEGCIPAACTFAYNEEILGNLTDHQTNTSELPPWERNTVAVVLEDLVMESSTKNLIASGQFSNIFLLKTLQGFTSVSKRVSEKFDYVFIGDTSGSNTMQTLFDAFLMGVLDYDEFKELSEDTPDHGFLVYDRANANILRYLPSVYRGAFRIGADSFY